MVIGKTFVAVLSLLCMLGISVSSNAQSWQRIGSDLNDVQWVRGETIVAVGAYGTIMRSRDGGRTWSYQVSGAIEDLNAVYFFSENEGIAGGNGGIVLATENGGETWSPVQVPVTETIRDIVFRDDNSAGLAVTLDGTVLMTSDRGRSWIVRAVTSQTLNAITLLGDSTAIAVGAGEHILRTTDFGSSWEVVHQGDTALNLADFTYSGGVGIAVGSNLAPLRETVLLKTTDDGSNWDALGTAPIDFLAHSVHITDDNSIVVAGQRPQTSDIYRERSAYTTDGGTTWTMSLLNEAQGFLDVKKIVAAPDDSERAIAVGTQGGIYLSSDGGQTWDVVSYARLYEPINQVNFYSYLNGAHFFNADTGVLYGFDGWHAGYALRTTDRGITWNSIYTNAIVNGVYFFDDNTGIGVPGTTVTVNTDRRLFTIEGSGAAWYLGEKAFDEEYHYLFTSGITRVNDNILAFTGDNMIFESTDRGESWTRTASLDDIVSMRDLQYVGNYGWVCGTYTDRLTGPETRVVKGGVFRTSISDRSRWELVYVDSGADYSVHPYALWFTSEQRGFMGDRSGTLYKTTDAGDTWDAVGQFNGGIADIQFFDDSVGFVVGNSEELLKTTNGGETWETEQILPTNPNEQLRTISSVTLLPDEKTVLLIGGGLIVRKEYPDRLTGVREEAGDDNGSGESLQFTLLPNPLVGGDNVVLQAAGAGMRDGLYRVQLYNALGKSVRSEGARIQARGGKVAEITVNVAGLPTGAYYVRLSGEGRVYSAGSLIIAE